MIIIIGLVQKVLNKIDKGINKFMNDVTNIMKFVYNEIKNSGLLKKVVGAIVTAIGVGAGVAGVELYKAGSYQMEKERKAENEAVKQHC